MFIILLIDIFQVLRSSPQPSTVQRQGAATTGNKLTTTAGFSLIFLSPPSFLLSSLFLDFIAFPPSGSVSMLFWASHKWRRTSTDTSMSRRPNEKTIENISTSKTRHIFTLSTSRAGSASPGEGRDGGGLTGASTGVLLRDARLSCSCFGESSALD